MASAQTNPVVQHIRKLTAGPSLPHQADGYLLDRFVTNRDESAFEILVKRYGSLVLGVCRHVLHHTHGFRILLHLSENGLFPREFALVGRGLGQLAARVDGLDLGLHTRQIEILADDDPRS